MVDIMRKDKKEVNTAPAATPGWLWHVTKGTHRYMMLLTVLQILLNIGSVCYSLLFRDLIDRAVEKQLSGFYHAMILLVALALAQLALRAVFRWLEEYARAAVENGVKHRFLGVLLRGSHGCVTAVHTGEWMNRLTSDTVVVADGMTQILPHLGGILVRMAGAFCVIVMLEPAFGAVIVPAGIAFVVVARVLRPRLKELHGDVQCTDGGVRMLMQERLDNQLIVRAFAQQERTLILADEKMEAHRAARMKRTNLSNIYTAGFGLVMQGMYLLGAFISSIGIVNGTVSFGTMTAILQLISLLQSPLSEISGYFTRWYAMQASAERLMEAERFPESHWTRVTGEDETLAFYRRDFSGINLENICFSYLEPGAAEASRITIRNLDMDIRKGEFIAITGSSGCGKSTLLKLLMGVYLPDSGRMRIRRRDPAYDRPMEGKDSGLFAYVPQGNQLMSGTIREILAFDDPEKMKQDERLRQALRIACADEFVAALPAGVDTSLGERGSGLSEGQVQRLAIARAVFSRRPILLLDEATSALDEETERRVLQNLRTMTDHTVLLVTHRPQACEICDRILSLSDHQSDPTGG